jgi:hypothetical protein
MLKVRSCLLLSALHYISNGPTISQYLRPLPDLAGSLQIVYGVAQR